MSLDVALLDGGCKVDSFILKGPWKLWRLLSGKKLGMYNQLCLKDSKQGRGEWRRRLEMREGCTEGRKEGRRAA